MKSFLNTCGFQLVFHWVSKLIHLTRMGRSVRLITIWIINEFEKAISNMAFIVKYRQNVIQTSRYYFGRNWNVKRAGFSFKNKIILPIGGSCHDVLSFSRLQIVKKANGLKVSKIVWSIRGINLGVRPIFWINYYEN